MQAGAASAVMLGLFNLGGGEIILILALVLILLGARKLPGLGRGLGRGISEFRGATKRLTDELDEEASEAGRSVGGVYGKPAAQALTPDNQVAELYDPAVLQDETRPRKRRKLKGLRKLWWRMLWYARGRRPARPRRW
jgi:sec-independent protein translocase protein TatA